MVRLDRDGYTGVMSGKRQRWGCRLVGGWLLAGFVAPGGVEAAPASAPAESGEEWVVLVPGLARTPRCMRRLKRALVDAGYRVRVLDYPSRSAPVETLAASWLAPELRACRAEGARTIHVVTHSLGGILLRQTAVTRDIPELGRVVMLGPPNRGTEVVDRLGGCWLFRLVNGPAGVQLGTGPNDLPARLPPPTGEIGILAGTRTINWFLSMLIPGRNDGKVAVERTRLDIPHTFRDIACSHPFLMSDREAIRETLCFLRHGRFTEGRTSK